MCIWENLKTVSEGLFGVSGRAIPIALCLVNAAMCQAQNEPFIDKLPDHLVQWKMLPVPGGEFSSGGIKHKVEPIWMGETEVTWDLFEIWALRMDLTQEQQVAGVDATSRPSKPYAVIFTNFGHHGFPAICMSHANATGFCAWLSEKTGRKYRLPTEVEWEYVCRAGSDQLPDFEKASWTWENAEDLTHKVGLKEANTWGFKDMFGNVAEWCESDGVAPVVRGGSWKSKAASLGFSTREVESPAWNEADPQVPKSKWWLANGQFIGMRLVCDRTSERDKAND